MHVKPKTRKIINHEQNSLILFQSCLSVERYQCGALLKDCRGRGRHDQSQIDEFRCHFPAIGRPTARQTTAPAPGLPHDGIEALESTFERRSQLRAKAFPDERYAGHPHRNCHVAGGKQYRRFVAHDHSEMLGGRNGCLGRRNPNRSRKPRLRLPDYP